MTDHATHSPQTSSARETELTLDDRLPLVKIVREFDATPDKVFRAYTDPELFVRWIGPDSLESSDVDRWDCRTGGEWRYVSRRGEDEFWFRGCFHEVRENESVVQTFSFEGYPGSVSLERLTLVPLEGGRTRLVATSMVDSFEARDAFVASGMETGVQEGYRKLDGLLETL